MAGEENNSRKLNRLSDCSVLVIVLVIGMVLPLAARQRATGFSSPQVAPQRFRGQTTQDYNRRLQQLLHQSRLSSLRSEGDDYQIGAEDLLQISVLEAPELSRTVRVADDGEISLPLLGTVRAAGLTSRGLELVLERLLAQTYMKHPHVSVFVQEMRSHPVSVFGAVQKPGVYQIRQPKTLIEVLSLAQGLADDAGDTVIVMHNASGPANAAAGPPYTSASATTTAKGFRPSAKVAAKATEDGTTSDDTSGLSSVEVNLKKLLESSDRRYNVLVYPGDVVKVTRAGIVYVVGQVHKPGGFLLKTNENISVLQALALAEGLTPDSAAKHARIVTADGTNGARREITINLDKILKGKAHDPLLHARDILFVPSSSRKAMLHGIYRSAEGTVAAVSGAAVYRW